MQTQQVGVDGVYDILAIRFIIDAGPDNEKDLCWQVYSIVTQIYEPIPERMRDWLTVPRPSGYESLHITVRTLSGLMVEVQIRSRRMDLVAEYGTAAHWAYKGVRNEQILNDWLNRVRKRLQNSAESFVSSAERMFHAQ
jgi:GTP pyrophosphokinase